MRHISLVGVLFGTLLGVSSAGAAVPAGGSGFELSARVGYGVPMGDIATEDARPADLRPGSGDGVVAIPAVPLSDTANGQVPFWLDAGYRINPSIFAGLYFQYGPIIVNKDSWASAVCSSEGANCSAHDVRLGVEAHYHFMPTASFDPWIGLGIGLEWLGTSLSRSGRPDVTGLAKGIELVNFQAGGDIQVAPGFGVGPFASFSLGQFSSLSSTSNGVTDVDNPTTKALHEWFVIGVRGVYDISM